MYQIKLIDPCDSSDKRKISCGTRSEYDNVIHVLRKHRMHGHGYDSEDATMMVEARRGDGTKDVFPVIMGEDHNGGAVAAVVSAISALAGPVMSILQKVVPWIQKKIKEGKIRRAKRREEKAKTKANGKAKGRGIFGLGYDNGNGYDRSIGYGSGQGRGIFGLGCREKCRSVKFAGCGADDEGYVEDVLKLIGTGIGDRSQIISGLNKMYFNGGSSSSYDSYGNGVVNAKLLNLAKRYSPTKDTVKSAIKSLLTFNKMNRFKRSGRGNDDSDDDDDSNIGGRGNDDDDNDMNGNGGDDTDDEEMNTVRETVANMSYEDTEKLNSLLFDADSNITIPIYLM